MPDLDERAIERARRDADRIARSEMRAEVAPRLVRPAIRAAVAGRVPDDQLARLLESMDLTRFLDDDGDVDHGKVDHFVSGLTGSATPHRAGFPGRWPGPAGHYGGWFQRRSGAPDVPGPARSTVMPAESGIVAAEVVASRCRGQGWATGGAPGVGRSENVGHG